MPLLVNRDKILRSVHTKQPLTRLVLGRVDTEVGASDREVKTVL